MTSDVLIGIPVCSHVTGTLNTSTFDNVTVTTSTAGPVVLYRETFGAPAGTDLASIPFDWQTFESNGVARTAVNVNRTATNPGDPTDAVNTTSAGPNQDGSFTAFATGWLYEQSAQRLAMTPEFSFNPADFSIIKFSWNQMNADATRGTRLAIRVGTQWYVHATVQNGGLGTATDWAANGQAKEVTFNPAAANWRILNFNGNYTMGATPGTGTGANSTLGNITVGAQPGANLSGTITAFGIFSDGVGTGNSRFDTFAITATSSSLPSPWASTDVGAVTAAGSASHSAGTFTLNGDGSDIFGTADAFLFVYQPASGDCDIRARVATIEPTNPWAKAGVMIRESLNANSAHAMTIISPSNGVSFQRRVSTGASSGSTTIAGIAAPHWVRMVRSGSTFTSSHSSDGVSWTTVGSTNITMGSSVFIGLPMTSHTPGVLGTSTIDNVTAVP
jgi:hypothetical protein